MRTKKVNVRSIISGSFVLAKMFDNKRLTIFLTKNLKEGESVSELSKKKCFLFNREDINDLINILKKGKELLELKKGK